MNTTAELHETLVQLEQAANTATPKAGKTRPRIQRVNAKLQFHPRTERLTRYTVALAQAMGLPAEHVSRVEAAAALHDIGRINVPVRSSAGRTSRNKGTAAHISRHPQLAAEIIRGLHGFEACVPAILYHHECYDGSGYPDRLKGSKIPLEARLLAVTDWFSDAITDEPNKPAVPIKEAVVQLQENSGTRFDPAIVTVFVDVVNSGIASAQREGPGRPRRRVNR